MTDDGLSTETLLRLINLALKAGDMRAVAAGLRVLAVQSPHDAQAILDTLALADGAR